MDGDGKAFQAETNRDAKHEADLALGLELLDKLRVMDDEFMRCVFRDQRELAQDVLRILTGMGNLTLVRLETQRDLKRLVGARSVELDVWGVDEEGRWYDFEVQRGGDPDVQRARYHSAGMDIEALGAGHDFAELPEQWVIFVMEEDPFGEGAGRYLLERADGGGGRRSVDCTHILYVNGQYRGNDALGSLMADFCQSDPSLIKHPGLHKRVEYLKKSGEGEHKMSRTVEEILADLRAEAMEQGLEQGREEGTRSTRLEAARAMMEQLACTAQRALELLKVPEAEQPSYLAVLEGQG